MSHGSTDKGVQNLTRVSVVHVLQLVWFVLICVSFVDWGWDRITLVNTMSARPGNGWEEEFILNINANGQVLLPPVDYEGDNNTLDTPAQIEAYVKQRVAAEKAKTKKNEPDSVLVLRIDKFCPFEKSYPIMTACRKAGYANVQLRVYRFQGPE